MPEYFVGLDLGQSQDYTALSVVERNPLPIEADAKTAKDGKKYTYGVRYLKRWHLGTSYTNIVADVDKLMGQINLKDSKLVIDGTGVGRAVVDMFRVGKLKAQAVSITITAGTLVTPVAGGFNVCKKDLVGVMQLLLQTQRLKIAPGLPEAKVLTKELSTFRVKVTAAANETFEAWRERDHDDMVFAVALPAWYAERGKRKLIIAVAGTGPIRQPLAPQLRGVEKGPDPWGAF